MKKVFTSGQVARICNVAPRTVSKWFDSGRLKGYRIPGSNDRRIPRENLIKFLKDHGLPADKLEAEQRLKVLVVGADAPLAERLKELLPAPAFQVEAVRTTFLAGLVAADLRPEAVLLDLSVGRSEGLAIAAGLRQQEAFAGAYLVALAGEDETDLQQLLAGGFSRAVQKPVHVEALVGALRARRDELFDDPIPVSWQASA